MEIIAAEDVHLASKAPTNKINGRDVQLIVEDTQLKAARAKMLLTKLYSDDKVDIVIGPTSSGVALAILSVPQEFKKILIVEPAVADAITGKAWNRYIFRTGRNSSQDAISNAAAVSKPGVSIACIAQDYAFGRDGVAAYKRVAEKLGAKIVREEYADPKATDFTAPIQRIIEALKATGVHIDLVSREAGGQDTYAVDGDARMEAGLLMNWLANDKPCTLVAIEDEA